MNLLIKAVILTKSSKYNEYCVAGIDIEKRKLIRFTSSQTKSHGALNEKQITYSDGRKINILDVIEKEIVTFKNPSQIQTENILIDTSKPFNKIATYTLNDVLKLYTPDLHTNILGNNTYVLEPHEAININYSLVLLKVSNLEFYSVQNSYGKIKIKLDFYYNNKFYTRFSITDPDYYGVKDGTTLSNAIIIVSLPDDEWSQQNGYYKFVAKIFPT